MRSGGTWPGHLGGEGLWRVTERERNDSFRRPAVARTSMALLGSGRRVLGVLFGSVLRAAVGVVAAAVCALVILVVVSPGGFRFSLDPFGEPATVVPEPGWLRQFELRVEAPLSVTAQVGAPLVAARELPFNMEEGPFNPLREFLQWSRCRSGRCEPIAGEADRLLIPRCDQIRCDVGWRLRVSVRRLGGSPSFSALTPQVTDSETSPEGWCRTASGCPAPDRFAAGACAVPGSCQALDTLLLARHQPDLRLSFGEPWGPVAVEDVVADFTLEAGTGGKPATLERLATTADPSSRLNIRRCPTGEGHRCYGRRTALRESHPRTTYARVWKNPGPQGPRFALQYWFFYYFDAFPNNAAFFREPTAWQLHEGDWEQITIFLDRHLQPKLAGYSSHCSGTLRPWREVEKRGSRPVAYVALGSHAHFFEATQSTPAPAACTRRITDRLKNLGARHRGFYDVATGTSTTQDSRPPDYIVNVTKPPAWLSFPGRWGETNLIRFFLAAGRWRSFKAGPAPSSPTNKPEWHNPLLLLQKWNVG